VRELGQLEAAVMDRLWAWGRPVTVREVLEDMLQDRSIAYTTVMTVMDNLHRKGVLTRHVDGRAYRYETVQSREQHTAAMMNEVLAGSNDRTATLMHLLDHMSPSEVARLRKALGEAPRTRKRPGR
jgi:predicted transcriptional regulator